MRSHLGFTHRLIRTTLGSATLLLVGCAFVDGKGFVPFNVNEPQRSQDLAAAKAEGKKLLGERARQVGPMSGSIGLVRAELQHHLRRTSPAAQSSSLSVRKSGGRFFGAGTYKVEIVADVSAEECREVIDAVQRLYWRLEGNPAFVVRLYRPDRPRETPTREWRIE